MLRLAIYSQEKIVHNFCQNLPKIAKKFHNNEQGEKHGEYK